jgi:HEAT repeat protein
LGSADADLRREGVLMLGEDQHRDSKAAKEILSIMARGDVDARVRAAAVKALAAIDQNDERLPTVLAITAKEDSALVRKESVLILAGRSDESSMDLLLDRLDKDDERDIRAEAAHALVNCRSERVLRSLIGHVGDEEFSVAYRCRESLCALTGEDFGYEEQAWRQWLLDTSQPFQNDGNDK